MTKPITKFTAAFLFLLLLYLIPVQNWYGIEANAAAVNTRYVKEVKVYTKTNGSVEDAQKWCDAQPENKDNNKSNDWYASAGDLNEGAAGALKSDKGVFLCYQTTNKAKEAITDLAVMNENGNYSEGAYEIMLKEQKEVYIDLVNDMKAMLEEYRANYANKVQTALQAHDFLNAYIEDDSQKRLGDFLLDVSDDKLVDVLLQSNSQVVLGVQEQLALACDTKESTWLDRMATLGSYKNLRNQFIKAHKNNTSKADKDLQTKYHDKALELSNSWDDIKMHIDNIEAFEKENGLDKLSKDEAKKWWDNRSEDVDFSVYAQECTALQMLTNYKYDGETLYDFFKKPYEEVSGENLKYLYPLAASMSTGQIASVNESVSIFKMVQHAATQTVLNDTGKGMAKVIAEEEKSLGAEEKKDIETAENYLEDARDTIKENDPVSVYYGVDRGLFEGGVAVTSTAEKYEKSAKNGSWSNAFVETGGLGWTMGILAVGSILSGLGSYMCKQGLINHVEPFLEKMWLAANTGKKGYHFELDTLNLCAGTSHYDQFMNKCMYGPLGEQLKYREAAEDLFEKGLAKTPDDAARIAYLNKLKIGLAVFAIILAVADIVMTVTALISYYNRDHLPIPKYMVDLSYNEDHETSYIAYKCASDDTGKQGDLNAGGGKQWLALYYTKDVDAGNPILAPDGDSNDFKVVHENPKTPVGYSPLHLFGVPNAAQNLTYADSKNGWSFNDDEDGTYMFFKRASVSSELIDDEDAIGTAISPVNIFLFGGIGLLLGFVIGMLVMVLIKRKKKD